MKHTNKQILIRISTQELTLFDADSKVFECAVSTATLGTGNEMNSYQTPLGLHRVRAKYGGGLPLGAVLVGRRWTEEVYSPQLAREHPRRDWILSRILWLCGCEPGYNRLGNKDTMRRYIYIHGAPDDTPFGKPSSIGCIRLSNRDIIQLYDLVPTGTRVNIR